MINIQNQLFFNTHTQQWVLLNSNQALQDNMAFLLNSFNLTFVGCCPEAETPSNIQEFQTEHFTSRVKSNIVIKRAKDHQKFKNGYQTYKTQALSKNNQCSKKIIQKQSRNVISNLLRIFFRNILEIKHFSSTINSLIIKMNYKITEQQFYIWLNAFSINFKNYIRLSQIKKLFQPKIRQVHHFILLQLINKYLNDFAVSHSLTSKRIQTNAIKMHLLGIRQLKIEVCRIKNDNKI